jgi:hypothetical protein
MEYCDVHDRASFVEYVTQLRRELDDPARSAEWENTDLPSFLDAMAAWARDWRDQPEANPWRHAADVITAATIYE